MITFDNIVKDKEYRERVIKFFRLPIRLSVSLEKFMSDLDYIRKVDSDKYAMIVKYTETDFNEMSKEQNTDKPDFTMENILEPIVSEIKEWDSWKEVMNTDYSTILEGYNGVTSTHQFYTKENDGKFFISIDLETANWQSLQDITGIEESYEDFITKQSSYLIPPVSKTMRTKLTALLSSKKIMDYNKYLLKSNQVSIIESILNHTGVNLNKEPFAFYADEFIIEVDEPTLSRLNELDLIELKQKVYEDVGIKVHLRPFVLNWLNVNKGCTKTYKDEFEFINLSKDIVLIMNKIINDVEIDDVDYEGIKLLGTKEEFLGEVKQSIRDYI